MKDVELKPCPICGRKPKISKIYKYYNYKRYVKYFVCCPNDDCVEQRMAYFSEEKAAENWNRRVDNG